MADDREIEMTGGINPSGSDHTSCHHEWQTVSMRFEAQILGPEGQVRIRQPDTKEGRVYLVCLLCASHTYMSTRWVGFRLIGSEDQDEQGNWYEEEC
jgi:hypothetical protein